jgi:hypothetical protein
MMLRVLSALLVLAAAAGAGVIHVPGDSATIQAGLRGAVSGDTVLVAPGTYPERLVWPARDGIVLLSAAGPESTVITVPDTGRVVTMLAGTYTQATELVGFTITGGIVSGVTDGGAGIKCSGSPVIAHDRIVRNRLTEFGYGAGVYATGAPLFHHNLVAWDTIANPGGGGWRYGPGVYCEGSGVFYQNVFEENAALGGAGGFWYGGGLALAGGDAIVFSNVFADNRIGSTTGGIAYGGGLYIGGGSAYVVNNTFFKNQCSTAIAYGGGIYVDQSWTSVIKNNIVVGNVTEGIGYMGGGIACYTDTIHDTLTFDYNDVWGNLPDNYNACYAGPNALSLDPLFAAGLHGEFYLSDTAAGQDSTSPCSDAGDTLLGLTPLNFDSLIHVWTTRTDSVPDMAVIDLGYHNSAEPITALAGPGNPARARLWVTVRPNPAHPGRAVVEYSTPAAGRVQVRVIDVAGRLRQVVLDAVEPAGRHTVALGRQMPAGVYVVALQSGGLGTSARCVVTK